MAIVQLKPTSGLYNTVTTLPEVLGAPNSSTFTSLYPPSKIDSLLKYVEGYPWTVNYYGQIVNTADTLEHLDPGTPSFNQPYYEILGAIIQVSSPLSSSYDETTSITSVTGSALVPFKLIPNVGDMFIAQIDTAEDAFFIINSVMRKGHRKESLYEINYSLYQYTSSNPGLLGQLKERVQESYHFNNDSNYYNRDALISPMEHKVKIDLKALVAQSQTYYFERFTNKASGTLLLPGTEYRLYDPYLSQFIAKTVSHDVTGMQGIAMHTQFERYSKQPVFWDMLRTRDQAKVFSLNQELGFSSTTQMRNQGRLGTAYHAGVDFMLNPIAPHVEANITFFPDRRPEEWHRGFMTELNSFVHEKYVRTGNNNTSVEMALLHPLFKNDSYIVTVHFYNYVADGSDFLELSYIEWLLASFVKRQAVAKADVVTAFESYGQWSVLHQFYLLPVLWLVAKAID